MADTTAGAAPLIPALDRLDLVLGPRPDGALAARLDLIPAGPRAPVLGLDLVVSADHRRATLDLSLPAAELADLAILASPGLALPAAGRFSARARAELDLVALIPLSASLDLDGDELRPAVPSSLAPPPATLRLRFRATEDFHGLVSDRFTVSAPGLDLALRRLEISVPPTLDAVRIAWSLRLDADPAVAWSEEWRRRIADLPPPFDTLGAEIRRVQVEGEGTGSLRLRDEVWRLEAVEFTQRHEARVGPTTLRAELVARQASSDAPVDFTFTLPEINPAAGRPADDPSPLAALDFPFAASVEARVTPEARLAQARVRLTAGPGRLRPVGPLTETVPFSALELDASTPDARVLTLEKARFTRDDTVLSAAGSTATLRPDGLLDLDLRLSAAVPRLDPWAELLPPDLAETLRPLGWTPADLGLEQLSLTAQATLAPDAPDAAGFTSETTARLRIGPAAIPVEFTARRESAAAPLVFSARLPRLDPSDWPGRPDPAFAWKDLRLPASVTLDGHLAPPDFAPHARLKLEAGPGSFAAPVPALADAPIAIQSLALEAALAGDPASISVPSLLLRLDHGIALGATDLRLDLRAHPIIDGRWFVSPVALADALAAWPATLEPDLRAQVTEHLRGGRLERLDGRIGLDLPADAPPVIRLAEADLTLAELAAAGPLLPGPVALDRLVGELRWPRLALRAATLRGSGAGLADLRVAVADATATPLVVTAGADFHADLAALPPAAAIPPGYTGRLSGHLAAETRLRPGADLPEHTRLSARFSSADFRAPDLVAGPFDAKLSGDFDARRHATFALDLDGSRLEWSSPQLRDFRLHPELRVSVGADLDPAFLPARADLAVATPELLGQPFGLKLAATWAAGAELPHRLDLGELAWGRTRLTGDFQTTPEGPRVALRAPLLDVPELWAALQARLALVPPAAPSASVPPVAFPVPPPASAPPAKPSSPVANLTATFAADRVDLGAGRFLGAIEAGLVCGADGAPRTASLAATEGEGNRFSSTLFATPDGLGRVVEIRAADVPAWAGALATPFRARPAPPEYTPLVANLETVANLLAGGSLQAKATLPIDQSTPRLDASVLIRNATLVRFPRIIQILALKSGRQLQKRPLVRELVVGQISVAGQLVKVGGVTLDGTGLIDNLKINTGGYTLDTEAITLDGSYFGIGFEVDGTRARPEIYLKDNVVIRAIGQTSELDFGDPPP